ncbi:MAG: hypothetical protein Q9219_003278 [cf. Caloplaca sp. 3 TL-2023]
MTTRSKVFLDVQSGLDYFGRIVIELFNDKAPKTCENFRAICSSSFTPPSAEKPLVYKGSPFHRVIEDFMIQGGDITAGNGTGGTSIYGESFEDENIGWRKIDVPGLVCMANRGKNTNNSQFFITLDQCEHLNTKHTVFGRVVRGMDVCERMAKVSVDKKDRPLVEIIISHCGELEQRSKPTTALQISSSKPKRINQPFKERNNGKDRRHSSSASSTASSSRSPSPPQRRQYRRHSLSPRRKNDAELKENRRDLTTTRPISPCENSSDSPPRHGRQRGRDPLPSRSRSPRRSGSPNSRRRAIRKDETAGYDRGSRRLDQRSTTNSYQRKRDEGKNRGPTEYGHAKEYSGRPRNDRQERSRSGRYDDGRLGGGNQDEEPGIKFKGRGSMKYRERKW